MKQRIIALLVVVVAATACKKEDQRPSIPGTTDIQYKTINATLAYEQSVALKVNEDDTTDISLGSVLIMHNNKPHLYLHAQGTTASGASIILSKIRSSPYDYPYACPLREGFTIYETATGERQWSLPQQKGILAAIMDDGTQVDFGGLWIGKQKRYLGFSVQIDRQKH